MSIIKRIWNIAKTEWRSILREPPPVFDEESWQAKKARYQTKGGYRSADDGRSRSNQYEGYSSYQSRSSGRTRHKGAGANSGHRDEGHEHQVDATERQYRANLEVDDNASLKEIRRSYKTLIRKYHPDLFHSEPEKRKVALEITTQLNEAMAYFEKTLR